MADLAKLYGEQLDDVLRAHADSLWCKDLAKGFCGASVDGYCIGGTKDGHCFG